MVSEHSNPWRKSWAIGLESQILCKIPDPLPALAAHRPYSSSASARRPWPSRSIASSSGSGVNREVRPVQPSSLSGYGGGPNRCLAKVPDIVPGKIPKPASISGKTTKSMVRYEEDASDPTAVWRIATAANHKADRVQQQKGDFQKVMTELHESMDRVEALLQRLVNSQAQTLDQTVGRGVSHLQPSEKSRSVEDLCQINLNSTQGIQLMSTTEGNFQFPSTYPSVVVTGWDLDPLPHAFTASPTLNNLNPSHGPEMAKDMEKGDCKYCRGKGFLEHKCKHYQQVNLMAGVSEDVVPEQEEFGIPSWLFGLSLPDAVDLAVLEMDSPTDLLKLINVGQSSALRVGQQCLAMGNPSGFDHILTAGVISGLNRGIFNKAGAHFHMKQGAFLHNLEAQILPKSLHCNFIRLTLEYFKYSSLDSYEFSACKMNRTLVSLMWILDQMPEERTILMKLLYFCKCCTDNEVINIWNKNHWKIEVGNVSSKHLVLALKIKSVLYLCDDNNENCEDDNMSLDNESDQDDDFFDTEVRPSEVDCYIIAPNDGNYKGHSGTISEKDTQDVVHKEELIALVREWICSRDIGTVDISDVLSNSPDISIAVVEDIMQQMLFKEPEGRQLFVSGHIWRGIEISGKMRSFNVVTKEAFEVSLVDVSQTQIQGQGAKGDFQSDEQDKLRSLKEFGFPEYNPIFMRNRRRNKRRGLYGYVAGLGDSDSILYKTGPIIGGGLLRRSGESLSLPLLNCGHNVARLVHLLPLIQLFETAEISVYDYFVKSRGIELRYSGDLPCINVGKLKHSTYFPIELCSLVPLQRYTKALSTLQRSLFVEKSRQKIQEGMSVLYDVLRRSNYDAELMLKMIPGSDMGAEYEEFVKAAITENEVQYVETNDRGISKTLFPETYDFEDLESMLQEVTTGFKTKVMFIYVDIAEENLAAYLKNEKLPMDEIKLTPLKLFEMIASIKNATIIGKIGLVFAALTFVVLLVRFLIEKGLTDGLFKWYSVDALTIVNYFATMVTIIVVAVPEGLPLAVTLSLAFAMKKLMNDKALVRHLSACETMESASTICTDKTGTLTTNHMVVDKIWKAEVSKSVTSNNNWEDLNSVISSSTLSLLFQGIFENTSAEVVKEKDGKQTVLGTPTERAILEFSSRLEGDCDAEDRTCTKVKVEPFNSVKKKMAILVSLPSGIFRWFCKGASEIILQMCDMMIEGDGNGIPYWKLRERILGTINSFASVALRTLCLARSDPMVICITEESVLLSLDPADFIIKALVPGAFHALKSAFIACLKCTHSSAEPWRARLLEAQNIINQGNSIEHTTNVPWSFGKQLTFTFPENADFIKGTFSEFIHKSSNFGSKIRILEDKYEVEGKEMSELEFSECERRGESNLKVTFRKATGFQRRARISSKSKMEHQRPT